MDVWAIRPKFKVVVSGLFIGIDVQLSHEVKGEIRSCFVLMPFDVL
jgi:hypothetical protein